MVERLELREEVDIARARMAARELAEELAFSLVDKTRIATAVSEIARNTLVHGGGGFVEMARTETGAKVGISCLFVDEGPGIPDLDQAMSDGFSTCNTLGQGLPGAKRLMHELTIESEPGNGTRVKMVRWL